MTGYLVPDDHMGSIDGYMSDEEMDEQLQDEEEETPPKLVKKRKLQNGDTAKADKIPLDTLLADTKKAKKDTNNLPKLLAGENKQADVMKKILEKKEVSKEESEDDSSEDDSDDEMDDSEVIIT